MYLFTFVGRDFIANLTPFCYHLFVNSDQLQTQIDSISRQLITKYKPKQVILFGSAVSGQMTADSDLDFLIIKDDKKTPYDRVVEVYRLVKKDIAADFIVYTSKELAERIRLGDPFIKAIVKEGRVLYG